tara:strand:+ start:980 stop:1375 length:396 start_codon:yes stop_codon:yes gene_type:complete
MAAKENHIEILAVEIEYDSKKWHLYLNGGLIKTASRSQDLIEDILFLRNLVHKEIKVLEIYNRNSSSTHRVNHWRLSRLVLNTESDMEEVEFLVKYNRKLHRRQPIQPIKSEVKRHDPKILRPILRDEKTW